MRGQFRGQLSFSASTLALVSAIACSSTDERQGSDGVEGTETTESALTSSQTSPAELASAQARRRGHNFNRVASFPVCRQLDPECDTDTETAAEIIAASPDGRTVVYSDSPLGVVGFVDISDPAAPVAAGTVAVDGEPTSVAVHGRYVLAAVNQSADFVNVAGELNVIDLETRESVRKISLGGQPDSIGLSPDGRYAAIAIENERDEDLGDGGLPQAPPGKLVVLNLDGEPANWTTTDVNLQGLAGAVAPMDPEPEFVDINEENIAAVTLQENNAIVLVDLASASVVRSFSAGLLDVTKIDATEDSIIKQTESLIDVPREPDGVAWLSPTLLATANEGDWLGGSRDFTVFSAEGEVLFSAANALEHTAARAGHYPEARSDSKGNEPENVTFSAFGPAPYLFVNSERSSLVSVFDLAVPSRPRLTQVLPAGLGPEGALALPERNLLVVASEEDSRGDKFRSVVNIYAYERAPAAYPTLVSRNRSNGTPIPWGAMSGLVTDPIRDHILYSIEDSFYDKNRIFVISTANQPARLVDEIRIRDTNGVFASFPVVELDDPSVPKDDPSRVNVFDEADLAALINEDHTVNIDPEGIAVAQDGGFWVASEGSGTIGAASRPINSLNLLFKVDRQGVIEDVVSLPDEINARQLRFGFEGVAVSESKVFVAFQRAWLGDDEPRLGIYDTNTQDWHFVFYPLDTPLSPRGGWVGLSDLTSLGDDAFLVLERDNQGGPDAAIKRLYRIDLAGVAAGSTISKTLVRDLIPDLKQTGGLVPEKVEGSAVTRNGSVWIINDNDGVDDNSGETQLLKLDKLLR